MERVEDLSARARRGELGQAAWIQLDLALHSSQESRLLHEAGCEFDCADSVLTGDELIARRVINRVLRLREGARRRRLKSYRVAVATIAWTAAAAAGAPLLAGSSIVKSEFIDRSPVTESQPRVGVVEARSSEPARSRGPTEDKAIPIPPLPQMKSADEPHQANSTTRSSVVRVEASTREQVTSGQVFAQANRLRREGRLSQAIAGYTDLQKRFPGSVEALTAEIGLGVLRLQSGSADIALHHFQRYLQRSPTGELAPEALWGQSQALTVLARQDAAKRSYNTLLSQYPDSAYASAARAKLRTLQ